MDHLRPFSRQQGVTAEHDLKQTAIAQVQLRYRGRQLTPPPGCQYIEIECEVYRSPDGSLMVHSACPRCRHSITIDGTKKRVEYDPEKGLFVEAFGCPWEMGEDHQDFGVGLCRLRLEYAGREARDA